MARPRKNASLDETIAKQEEAVMRVREKYDAEVKKLRDLYAKRKRKHCLKQWKRAINLTKRSWAFYPQIWRNRNDIVAGR